MSAGVLEVSDSETTDESELLLTSTARSRSATGLLRPIRRRRFRFLTKRELIRMSFVWAIGILIYGILFAAVIGTNTALPAVVPDTPQTNATFSEERAHRYLVDLVQGIGSRPYGSTANRNSTMQYLLTRLRQISDSATAKFGAPRMEIMLRQSPGHKGNHEGRRLLWDSMDNILVRVYPQNYNTSDQNPPYSTLMISSHYDTVTYSPGAYDDTSGVAVALEILNITAHTEPSRNQLFVMFNNGEEIGLLGARAFVRFDPLYEWVDAVINMDSTPGTKAVLLRTSGSELDYHFRNVPRPFASPIATDVFNARLISSETDFVMYTSQTPTGAAAGFDFAFFQHRQAYHTLKDNHTKAGSLQFLGDNILELTRSMLDSETLGADSLTVTPTVIYSVLQSRAVIYSRMFSFVLHLLVTTTFLVAFPLLLVYRLNVWRAAISEAGEPHPITTTIWSTLRILSVILVATMVCTILGLTLRFYNSTFYYSNLPLGVFSFAAPTWFGMYIMEWFFVRRERRHKIPVEVAQKFRLYGVVGFWLLLMVITLPASFYYGSTYLIFWFGLCALIGVALHHLLHTIRWVGQADIDSSRSLGLAARNYLSWMLIFCVMSVLPVLLLLDVSYPLMQQVTADMPTLYAGPIIAVITSLMSINFIIMSRRAGGHGILVLLLFVASAGLFISASVSKPFTEKNPYQVHMQHEVNYGSPNVTELSNNTTIPVVGSLILMEQVLPYSLKLGNFAIRSMGLNETRCNDAEIVCKLENFGGANLPNNQPPLVRLVSDIRPENDTHRYITLEVFSPESYIHEISTSVQFGNSVNATVNGIKIDADILDRFMFLFSGTATSFPRWTMTFTLSSHNAILNVHLSSRYDSITYSERLQFLVSLLPEWSTVAGEGEGMIRVDTTWTF